MVTKVTVALVRLPADLEHQQYRGQFSKTELRHQRLAFTNDPSRFPYVSLREMIHKFLLNLTLYDANSSN